MFIAFNKHIIHIYKWFFYMYFHNFYIVGCCFVLFHLCRQDFCFVFRFSGFVRQLLGSVWNDTHAIQIHLQQARITLRGIRQKPNKKK